jgi:F-type H+-transporting ATPase subunit a
VNRIHLVQLLAVIAVVLFLWLGTRRMKVVPGRFQSLTEMGLGFVRTNVAHDMLGRKDGDRFLPILTTIFFMVLFMNITGIIPFLNMPGTAIVAVPLTLAVVSYVTFIYAGMKRHGFKFFKNSLFPQGVPAAALPFFFFTAGGGWAALGVGTLAFGGAFTLFEILVAVLQAYVFTVLTAVYIQLAVAEEH